MLNFYEKNEETLQDIAQVRTFLQWLQKHGNKIEK